MAEEHEETDDVERPWIPDLHHEPDDDRRRWIPVAALGVLPWLVVGVVALRGDDGAGDAGAVTPPPAPTVSPTSRSHAPPSPAPTPRDAGAPTTGASPRAGVLTGGSRTTPGLADAVATASVTARTWLGGVGPGLPAEGVTPVADVYLDHLAVAGVDHPAPGHVVVSLVAVLLHRSDGSYDRAEVRGLAVPVALDGDGARPAGQPWWLPAPSLDVTAPRRRPIEDEGLLSEAGAALEDAGYRDVAVEDLAAAGQWALIVTASGIAPGDESPATHEVWLRRHLSRLVVAGSTPGDGPGDGPGGGG